MGRPGGRLRDRLSETLSHGAVMIRGLKMGRLTLRIIGEETEAGRVPGLEIRCRPLAVHVGLSHSPLTSPVEGFMAGLRREGEGAGPC